MSPHLLASLVLALCIGTGVQADCTCDRQIHTKLRIWSASPLGALQSGFLRSLGNGVTWNENRVVAHSAYLESDDVFSSLAGGSKAITSNEFQESQVYPIPGHQEIETKSAFTLGGKSNNLIVYGSQNKDGSTDIVIRVRLIVSGPRCSSDDLTDLMTQVAPASIEVLRSVEDMSVAKCRARESNQCPCLNGGSCSSWTCNCPRYYFGDNCEAHLGLRDVVSVAVDIQQSCLSWPGFPFSVRDAMDASGFFSDANAVFQCVETDETTYFVIVNYVSVNSGYGLAVPLSAWASTTFAGYATQVFSRTRAVVLDCSGKPGGLALVDACGQCNGNNDCLTDMSVFLGHSATPSSLPPAVTSPSVLPASPAPLTSSSSAPVSPTAASVSHAPVSASRTPASGSVSPPTPSFAAASVSVSPVSSPLATPSASPIVYLSEGSKDSFSRTKLIVPVSGALLGVMVLGVAARSRLRRPRRSLSVARASPLVVATDMAPGSTIVITVSAMSK